MGAICSEVAERGGPDFPAVLRQPFALTLYAWQQLQERDRIAALRGRERDLYRGVLMAMAFNEPKRLDEERAGMLSALRAPGHAPARRSRLEALEAAGLALAERIEQSGVMLDDPARRN